MAERKMAVSFLLVALAVVGALVPAATADACTDECYKECEKGKAVDAGLCTKKCDGRCHLKAYAAATPAEMAAKAANFAKESADSRSAAAASAPGFERLKDGCVRECKREHCRAGKKKKENSCSTRCEDDCRGEAEGLAINGTVYAQLGAKDREAVIVAIDKHASGPEKKFEALAATCVERCGKFCDKDHDCDAICGNGCRARALKAALSLATPAQKEAINKDIQATPPTAS